MPIPYEPSPVRYADLRWHERELGDLVEKLTKAKVIRTAAHLDPDLRPEMRPRLPAWKRSLGQHKMAQGHLKKNGVGVGDLFLFWGLFRHFDEGTGWSGERQHIVWGWLQVGEVVSVDETVRPALESGEWLWAADHPHLALKPDPSNTLYVAADHLVLDGDPVRGLAGAGVFDYYSPVRHLSLAGAGTPLSWSLPSWFLPGRRPALSHHRNPERWSTKGDRVLLRAASRGQEFILDASEYPEAIRWATALLTGGPCMTPKPPLGQSKDNGNREKVAGEALG